MLARHHLFQGLAYFGACFGSCYNVQPVLFGRLGVRCHNLHLVTAVQLLFELYIFSVYFCTDTFTSQLTVNVKGKIEYGRSFGQFEKVSFGGKYEYFIFV